MTKNHQMSRDLWIPLTLAFLAASSARGQDFDLGAAPVAKPPPPFYANSLQLGLGLQTEDSYFFSRYGGPTKSGVFPIVSGAFAGGAAWDSDSARYWRAKVGLYGFDLRSVAAEAGEQGKWKVAAFYDAFTRNYTQTARSPFDNVGTTRLTLPADWNGTASSLTMRTLQASLKPLDLKTQWQTIGGDVVMIPYAGYELRVHYDHRVKDGLKANSLTFGPEANFPVGVFFPQPIEYETNRVTASVSYADPRLQWEAAYSFSAFTDGAGDVFVPNPYARSSGIQWPAGAFAGYPFAVAQYSQPPDNVAHQALLTGGYLILPRTRITARLSYAVQLQDETFLPYTSSQGLSAPLPLPRPSLDGKIRKTFASLGVTSREWRNVDLAASYTYDDRDNQTPSDLYCYVANEGQDQPQPLILGNSRYCRFNLPHSFTFQQAKAEAGWRVWDGTRLSVTYDGSFRERTLQEVAHTTEHTVKGKVLTAFGIGSAWVSYSYASRTGTAYEDALPWDLSHTTAYLNASPANQSISHPLLRRYNMADRDRNEQKGGATVDVSDALTANVSAGFASETYSNSTYGLRSAKWQLLDGDLSYVLKDHITASAFYSFERIRSFLAGYYLFTNSETNPNQVWQARTHDQVHSAGVRADWTARDDLRLTGAYYTSAARTRILVTGTVFTPLAAVAPLPDATDLTHNWNLQADYELTPQADVRVGYTVEWHRSRDWQYANISVAPVAQILGSGITPPRYTIHVISLSTRYQF